MGAEGDEVGGVGGSSMAGNNFADYGGIDPHLDPELAMAIRASTEEARAREEARVRPQRHRHRLQIYYACTNE